MMVPNQSNLEADELNDLVVTDIVCDRFERDWLQGRHPSPLDYIQLVDSSTQSKLLQELVRLEENLQSRFLSVEKRSDETERNGFAETNLEGSDGSDLKKPAELELGTRVRFGRFHIVRELGEGSSSFVYEAYDPELHRRVALKVQKSRVNDATERDFVREAKVLAQLRHPNIIGVHDAGRIESRSFLVREFVEGETLRDRKSRSMDHREAVRLVTEIAQTIHYAHEQKVIHRDLKPSNILLAAGGSQLTPKIFDFGIAKWLGAVDNGTRTGQFFGTPAYASPEQVQGHGNKVTPQSDIYALGVILYELLSGSLPYREPAKSDLELFDCIVKGDWVPLRTKCPSVPVELETICDKCMRRDPSHRYVSAEELADDLDRWLKGQRVVARPEAALSKWVRASHGYLPYLYTACLTIILFVGGYAIQQALLPTPVGSKQIANFAGTTHDLLGMIADGTWEVNDVLSVLENARPSDVESIADSLRSADAKEKQGALFESILAANSSDGRLSRGVMLIQRLAPQNEQLATIAGSQIVESLLSNIDRSTAQEWGASGHELLRPYIDSFDQAFRLGYHGGRREFLLWILLGCYEAEGEDWIGLIRHSNASDLPVVAQFLEGNETRRKIVRNKIHASGVSYPRDEVGESEAVLQADLRLLMFKLGEEEYGWEALDANEDPRLTTYFLHHHRDAGFGLQRFLKQIPIEKKTDRLFSELHAVAVYPLNLITQKEREKNRETLVGLFQKHPDTGVHMMSRTILENWLGVDAIAQIENSIPLLEIRKDRDWFRNSQGLTFHIMRAPVSSIVSVGTKGTVPVGEVTMKPVKLNYSFAISVQTVPEKAILQWKPDAFEVRRQTVSQDTRSALTLREVVEYCDWLTLEERLGEYEDFPIQIINMENGKDELAINLLRKGYRLPTAEEWECTARAGTGSVRWFGEMETPYTEYYFGGKEGSSVAQRPIANLPNRFGMRNTLGVRWEWTCTVNQGSEDDKMKPALVSSLNPHIKLVGSEHGLMPMYAGSSAGSFVLLHLPDPKKPHSYRFRLLRVITEDD